jgi:hypothetical protein
MARDYPDTYGLEQGTMPDDLYAIYKPIYDKYDKLIRSAQGKGTEVDWNEVIDRAKSPQEVDKIMDQIYAAGNESPELIDRALIKKESFKPTKASAPTRFAGKLIYAEFATVDPVIFEKYDVVNADDILKDVLRDNNLSSDPNFESKPGLLLYSSPNRVLLEKQVEERVKALLKEGKTVVSSNWFLRDIADVASFPSSSKAVFSKDASSPEESVDQFNAYISKNETRQNKYDATQVEGWESITYDTKGNVVEKSTNKTVKELFEKGTINSTFVEMMTKAPNIKKLQDAVAQYLIPANRNLFNKTNKAGEVIPLTFGELTEIYEKRAKQFYNQGMLTEMELAEALQFVEDFASKVQPSKPSVTDTVNDESKKDIKDAVDSATDPANKIQDIQDLDEEVRSTSKKEIDDDFLDGLNDCPGGKIIN